MKVARLQSLVAACGGASAVEFALVAPLFFMLLFGCIEFGRLLWTQEALQQAAIAGARCMGISQGKYQASSCASGGDYSSTSTTSYIQNVASGWGMSIPSSGITLNPSATCGGVAGFSEVTINATFTTVVPQIVLLAAGGTSLTATACYPNNPF
jgi:Flp pilus assembly protein TadG